MSKAPAPDAVRLVPCRATPQQLEAAAFNLSAEIGAEEAIKLAPYIERAYELLVAAAPAPATARGGDALRIAVEALEKIRLESEDCLGLRMETITGVADHALAALASQPQATGGAVERESDLCKVEKAITAQSGVKKAVAHGEISVRQIAHAVLRVVGATQPAPSPGGWVKWTRLGDEIPDPRRHLLLAERREGEDFWRVRDASLCQRHEGVFPSDHDLKDGSIPHDWWFDCIYPGKGDMRLARPDLLWAYMPQPSLPAAPSIQKGTDQ